MIEDAKRGFRRVLYKEKGITGVFEVRKKKWSRLGREGGRARGAG